MLDIATDVDTNLRTFLSAELSHDAMRRHSLTEVCIINISRFTTAAAAATAAADLMMLMSVALACFARRCQCFPMSLIVVHCDAMVTLTVHGALW